MCTKLYCLVLTMIMCSTLALGLTPRKHSRSHKGHLHSSTKLFPASTRSVASENIRANALGYPRILSKEQLQQYVASGNLVPIRVPCQSQLPKDRRYLRPETEEFLEQLNHEFERATGTSLVVDSAVRPASVQRRLVRWNRNAAPAYGDRASTHERGTTVDLSRRMRKAEYTWLLWRLFYYQALGKVLVIQESTCLHIFVGEDLSESNRFASQTVWVPDSVL